jgi:two-component system, chemotaxis family, response regulator Rcp1
MTGNSIKILLLIEDSPGDVRLTKEALRAADASVDLHVVEDGVAAMAFLTREGVYANAPRPDLILLDLNLPKMDGREVLGHIKKDGNLKTIPTIVLTTSDSEADILISYKLNANCYLSKPGELGGFERLVKGVIDFWLRRATFPPRRQAA